MRLAAAIVFCLSLLSVCSCFTPGLGRIGVRLSPQHSLYMPSKRSAAKTAKILQNIAKAAGDLVREGYQVSVGHSSCEVPPPCQARGPGRADAGSTKRAEVGGSQQGGSKKQATLSRAVSLGHGHDCAAHFDGSSSCCDDACDEAEGSSQGPGGSYPARSQSGSAGTMQTILMDSSQQYERLVCNAFLGELPPAAVQEPNSEFPGVVFHVPALNKDSSKLNFRRWFQPGIALVCGQDGLTQEVTFCNCCTKGKAVLRHVEIMHTFEGGCKDVISTQCEHVRLVCDMIASSGSSPQSIILASPDGPSG